jgi:glycosyltransferase involved in cell wall biosynthesis
MITAKLRETSIMKKKILVCCNAYPPHFIGGAELVAHAQAKQLQEEGYEVLVFTGDPSEHGQRHSIWREDYEGIPVYRIHLTYEDYDYKFINFTHKDVEDYFRKILKTFSPDIVHFHNIIGLSVGLIHIAKSNGIKTVVTLHDHWGFCFKNTLIKRNNEICQDFTRCSECMPVIPGENNQNVPMRMRQDYISMQLEDVDVFISPSQYLADAYIRAGIPSEKMHVIWNGLDVKKFSNIKKKPDPSGCIRFTFIGYFGKHKGIHVLLDALNYLELNLNFRINLVGSGELLNQFKQEIAEKGLSDRVKFWGRIENIEDAYAETDVFILPSVWPENQPVSITEAMSAKIPVIASNSGGIPELVVDNKTGFLFNPGDGLDLAKKMQAFITDPSLIRMLGFAAYDRIKRNTLENQIILVLREYAHIVESNRVVPIKPVLIACVGESFCSEIGVGICFLSKSQQYENCRLLMHNWLQSEQMETIKLLCICDYSISIDKISYFLKLQIPLLVPQKNVNLVKLCNQAQCGLYYSNEFEFEACLNYFLRNDTQRVRMGKNAFDFFNRVY